MPKNVIFTQPKLMHKTSTDYSLLWIIYASLMGEKNTNTLKILCRITKCVPGRYYDNLSHRGAWGKIHGNYRHTMGISTNGIGWIMNNDIERATVITIGEYRPAAIS